MPISTSLASYKDRTSEFQCLIQRLKRFQASEENDASYSQKEARVSQPSVSIGSDFSKRASRISLRLHDVSQKITRLSRMIKKTSIFDDPAREIGELTVVIKQDITTLNAALSELQTVQNSHIGDGNISKDSTIHFTTILDDLNNRLKGITKEFKDVLVTRSENIKAHENRKKLFSSSASKGNSFGQQRTIAINNNPTTNTELPPWTNRNLSVDHGSQLRRRTGIDGTTPMQMEGHAQQQLIQQQQVQQHDTHTQSRATALQNVESTISELGNMFTQLATMVSHQGELAIRIDDDMDESLCNVERAQDSLLKHLRQISSNRWLIIKIFMVLIIFILIFIIFVA